MLDLTQSVYRVVLIDSVCGLPKNSTPHICLCDVCYFYRPQRRCGQGNVFTAVCDSVHRGVLPRRPPQEGGPLPRRPPPQEGHPPKRDTPPRRRHPPSRLRHTVNERLVRILLECIFVLVLNVKSWVQLVSLHICSMWETICDAWACWSGWYFGPNSTEYPYSEIQFENTPPPPPPANWKLSEILALWLFSFRIPPSPRKLKFRQILAI